MARVEFTARQSEPFDDTTETDFTTIFKAMRYAMNKAKETGYEWEVVKYIEDKVFGLVPADDGNTYWYVMPDGKTIYHEDERWKAERNRRK